MKSKSRQSPKKDKKKKLTKAEKEKALVDFFVKIILQNTLKEFYERNNDSQREAKK